MAVFLPRAARVSDMPPLPATDTSPTAHDLAGRILDDLGDGVLLLDDAGVVRSCNPAAAAILGISIEQALGSRLVDACPGWSAVAEHDVATDSGGAVRRTTVQLRRSDRTSWLDLSVRRSCDGALYTLRDVTAEYGPDQARRDLVSTVSHELRTPIASVYGAAVTLGRDDIDLDDAVRRQLTRTIEQESERLAKLVDDLLVAQKLEDRRLTLVHDHVDTVDVITQAATAFRVRGIVHGRELDVSVDPSVLASRPLVDVDQQRIQQVLGNLLENARSYSPAPGRIELGCTITSDRMVRIWVRDEGIGIDPAHSARVFERFYRVRAETRSCVGGMGLGLYLCRELVRRMHGEIRVRSIPGRGSTFTVELPIVARS